MTAGWDAAPAGGGKRTSRAPGGAGTPPPGHDDPGARSSLTAAAARLRQKARPRAEINAAVERREAPASFKRGCGKTEDWCATRCSIPSMWSGDRKGPAQAGKGYGVPGAAKNTGGGAWLFDRWIGEQARHTLCCRPRAGGDPVNTASAVITGSPAGACHRAGLWPDPLAGDDNRSKRVRPAVARTAPFQQISRIRPNRCPSAQEAMLFLLSQKVAREARPDSGKGRDSDISRWGLIWISERQTTVNRDLRGMSRGL